VGSSGVVAAGGGGCTDVGAGACGSARALVSAWVREERCEDSPNHS